MDNNQCNDHFQHECQKSDEVVFSATSFACTSTEPGIKSNDNTWVGLGNSRDVLIGNEYKSAEDCSDLSRKREKITL